MSRPTKAERWERVAVEKTKQMGALRMENMALKEQVVTYRAALRDLDGVMSFAGRVDYTSFVRRSKAVLMRVRKWERTVSAHQHFHHDDTPPTTS